MKLTDKEGLEIASVVKDVLEGKAVKKEKKNVKEVEEPRPGKEKEFKKKHVIKKSGENPDGSVTKEDKEQVDEILGFAKKAASKAKKGIQRGVDKVAGTDTSGDKKAAKLRGYADEIKDLKKKQKDADERLAAREKEFRDGKIDKEKMDDSDDFYNGLWQSAQDKIDDLEDKIKALKKESVQKEEVDEEEVDQKEAEDKKAKYKKFFQAALKKFGVKSPAELEGEKKKEFFDYVDKNYNADNESD